MDQATETAPDPNLPVSHEMDGRVLTGVGTTAEALAETMERHSPDPEPATDAAPAEAPPSPKPSRGQRRFADLTREREEAKREAESLRQRTAQLERERDEWRSRAAAPPAQTPAPTPAPAPVASRPKPSEDQVGTTYASYADFVEDLADWKSEQRLSALDFDARIRTSIEADRASRAYVETVEQHYARGRQAYPDFDAVLTSGPGAQISLAATREDYTRRVQQIMRLPDAAHVLYTIGRDAAAASQIANMDDFEFGRWISSLAPSQRAASPASTPVGSPVVPAPYQPVGTGTRTTAIPSSDLPKKAGFDFDSSGYREKRAQERASRRGGFRR